MAVSKEHIKQLAYKHLHAEVSAEQAAAEHNEALRYINRLESGILKELRKLDAEYEEQLTHSNKPDYIERIERNYIHWRHILISVFEPLKDAHKHWNHHTGLSNEEPPHNGKF